MTFVFKLVPSTPFFLSILSSPVTHQMTSVSDAPDDDSIGDEGLGYIITPLPDFKVLARDIQNQLRKSLNGAMHT